jgi:hypothetical protein
MRKTYTALAIKRRHPTICLLALLLLLKGVRK